jgi:hypothetical protein
MEDRKVAVVVASNREEQFSEFVDRWHGKDGFPWDLTILVQDGGGRRFPLSGMFSEASKANWVHHDWDSIATMCGKLPDWLARRDSGIKTWGFLDAVIRHDANVVIALDDDCLPCALAADPSWHRKKGVEHSDLVEAGRTGFVEQHLRAIFHIDRWTTSIPDFIPRGMPYGTNDHGHRDPRVIDNSLGALPVPLNMGVWATIPDRDAVHELTNWTPEGYYRVWKPQRAVYRYSRVMSPRQYWPMCGMNLAFHRDIAPLMYFPRMGEDSPFRRFDDIWCGVIAQKCLAHLGWACAVGKPIVNHMKASRPMDNLVRESPGIKANEEFWTVIDGIRLRREDNTPLRCMQTIGDQLDRHDGLGVKDDQLALYLPKLGRWIEGWCDQFVEAGWEL